MSVERAKDAVEMVAGSVLLSIGLALSAVYASAEQLTGVVVGFLLFVAGYKGMQFGAREGGSSGKKDTAVRGTVREVAESARMVDLLMVLVGVGVIAQGFVSLFRSLQTASLTEALTSSVLLFLGYGVAHYGVNKTPV